MYENDSDGDLFGKKPQNKNVRTVLEDYPWYKIKKYLDWITYFRYLSPCALQYVIQNTVAETVYAGHNLGLSDSRASYVLDFIYVISGALAINLKSTTA